MKDIFVFATSSSPRLEGKFLPFHFKIKSVFETSQKSTQLSKRGLVPTTFRKWTFLNFVWKY